MRKQILPYIFSVACVLSACSTDYYNEPDSGKPGENEMLTLTVSASQPVIHDGVSTRAINDDTVSYTEFEVGDSIGVIIMDATGRLLADNVPYRFDGAKWAYDADKDGEEKRPYYDAAMSSYIVYFPYTPTANGCTSVDRIKTLTRFAHQDNQNLKKDYLSSDIMVWTYEGKAIKHIEAEMSHVYNTFSLAQPNIKWDIVPTGEKLEYTAKDETLSDFVIEYTPKNGEKIILKDNEKDSTYRATDRSYRYLLPNDQGGVITWQYTYRGITFHGKRIIPEPSGTRFSNSDTAYMGELPGPKMQFSDFYCSTADRTGYVLPWDAEEQLPGRHCIGLVVYVGQNRDDLSDYSDSKIQKPRCQGYVISLTDAYDEPLLELKNNINTLPWWTGPNTSTKIYVGTNRIDNNIRDWGGYYNQQAIKQYAEANFGSDLSQFPAAFVCEYYGNKIIKNDYGEIEILSDIHTGLEPPDNTTGWFLPTGHMLFDLKNLNNILIGGTLYVTSGNELAIDKVFLDRRETLKKYAFDSENGDPLYDEENCNYLDGDIVLSSKNYWGSNECYNTQLDGYAICSNLGRYRRHDSVYDRNNYTISYYIRARPVLAF